MLIGLTGKTGCGKSSAADILRKLGAYTIDCDEIAHRILTFPEIKERVKSEFGLSVFNESGEIERKKLGTLVFANSEKLKKLNSIVHPAIVSEILSLADNAENDFVVIDGSELESSGIDEKCRHIIVIEADESVRLRRIMERDGIDKITAIRRINAQHNYSKKAVIVENNKGRDELYKKLEDIYTSILRKDCSPQ